MTTEDGAIETTEGGASEKVRDRASGWSSVLAVLAVPFFALRALSVAGFKADTALAIISNSSISAIAPALAMVFMPVTAGSLGTLGAIYLAYGIRAKKPVAVGISIGLILLSLFFDLEFVSTWLFAVMDPMVIIVTIILVYFFSYKQYAIPFVRSLAWKFNVASWVMLSAITPIMWLPPQVLDIRGKLVTGYILTETDRYVTILYEHNRTALVLPQNEVKSRQYCHDKWAPLLDRSSALPKCP